MADDPDDLFIEVTMPHNGTAWNVTAAVGGPSNHELRVVLQSPENESLATRTVVTNDSGAASVDFGTRESGEYRLVVDDPDGNASVSTNLTVLVVDPGLARIEDPVIRTDVGSVVTVPVGLAGTDRGTVAVDDSTGERVAVVHLEDGNEDGTVALLWDTGESGSEAISAVGNDTATLADETANLGELPAGAYDLLAWQGWEPSDAQDISRLTLVSNGTATTTSTTVSQETTSATPAPPTHTSATWEPTPQTSRGDPVDIQFEDTETRRVPGFGVPAVLTALAASALLASRRL
ncbi:DUF7827 domain-containing protein [Haloarchaeobius sp. DT45]|uniref:DUF7827 domain-containing protein n=1 Tax=Haloarchaeobius sp. DT45 TaxID=3446116 RepID=UPI003F6C278F